ncbi:MAG: hypothetical protein GX154_01580 [Clostridiales bacterium]|nr:hypothetical protein [Clostridiales bacterium]
MKKRTISIILLCLTMSLFFSIPVFAAGKITLDKSAYTTGEKVRATVSGLTQEEIDDNAAVYYAKQGERYDNFECIDYVMYLPANNVCEFNAPSELGTFEVALLDGYNNYIASTTFKVGVPKAKEGDIKISKSQVKLNEPMSVTINGLSKEMIDNNAHFGICKANEKLENSGETEFIMYLPADNTYQFKAPSEYGKYEVRVFSSGITSSNTHEAVFFGSVSFDVVSSKAKPGDIVLSKTTVQPGEKMSITVNGLTQGEIDNNAFFGVSSANEKIENTNCLQYVMYFKTGNIYEFEAPSEPGNYEARVFCASVDPSQYSYALFGVVPFTVSGAPTGEIAAGTEGLSTWAASVVNEAKGENLVTDKVLLNFPAPITREEFCELAVLLYEKMTRTPASLPAANPFSDTTNPQILKAVNLGITGGIGGGKFAPNNNVTRQEISVMLLRTLKTVMPKILLTAEFKTQFQDVSAIDSWALESVRFMNANDILTGSTVNGVSYIMPKGNTTREQAIALVLRIYNKFNQL